MAMVIKIKVTIDPSYNDPDAVAKAMEDAARKMGAIVMSKTVSRENPNGKEKVTQWKRA